MRTAFTTLAAAAVLSGAAQVPAADLAKVDRSLAKQPAYQTAAPRYCLLVFGPEARFRVWLVQDGDVLYVDRNGNGDLTEPGERVEVKQKEKDSLNFEAGDVRDGDLTHSGLSVTQMHASPEWVGSDKEVERLKGAGGEPWLWSVRVTAERPAADERPLPRHVKYVANGDGRGMLMFSARPQDAPVIHFNGPWTLGLQDLKQRFTADHKSELQIGVGTPGAGPGTFAFVLYPDTIPADVRPVAEVSFPPRLPGGQPVVRQFTLTDRC